MHFDWHKIHGMHQMLHLLDFWVLFFSFDTCSPFATFKVWMLVIKIEIVATLMPLLNFSKAKPKLANHFRIDFNQTFRIEKINLF